MLIKVYNNDLFCPHCGITLSCPCIHCAERNEGLTKWEWLPDGECVKCPRCNFTQHADYWSDIDIWQSQHRIKSLIQRIYLTIKWYLL